MCYLLTIKFQAPFRYGYVAKDDGYRRASYKSDYAYAPAHVEEQGSCPPWGTSSYSNGKIGGRSCFPGTNKYPKTDYAYQSKQYSEPSYIKTEYAPTTYDYVKPTPVKHTTYTDDYDYVKPTYAAEVYDVKPYHAPTKAYYAPEARAVEQGSCAPWGVSSYEHGKVGGRSCFPGARSAAYPKTEYAPAKPAAVEYNKPNWHYRRQ